MPTPSSAILDSSGRPFERRTVDPVLKAWILSGRSTFPGGPANIQGLPAVQAIVGLLARIIASLPLHGFRRVDADSREPVGDLPALEALSNSELTQYELLEAAVTDLLIGGHGYWVMEFDPAGRPIELTWLPFNYTTVERLQSGRLRYTVNRHEKAAVPARYMADEVLHFRYRLQPDGIMGISPITASYLTFTLNRSLLSFQNQFFDNSTSPSMVLETAQVLSEDAFIRLKTQWDNRYSGTANAGATVILEEGMSATPVSHNAKDAALDELRFNEETICRVYGVPPPVAGLLRYSTYANIQSAIELMAKTCLTPWITRLEHTINRKLLSVAERRAGVYLKFSLEGLLRGNSAERAAFYSSLISNGVLSINEARRHEELPAVPGGDQHLVNAGQAAVTTGGSTMVGAPAPAE